MLTSILYPPNNKSRNNGFPVVSACGKNNYSHLDYSKYWSGCKYRIFRLLPWPSLCTLSARMGFIIHFFHMGARHMRVDLRAGNAGMAQQLLHGAQIRTVFQEMRGEAVAQTMR